MTVQLPLNCRLKWYMGIPDPQLQPLHPFSQCEHPQQFQLTAFQWLPERCKSHSQSLKGSVNT